VLARHPHVQWRRILAALIVVLLASSLIAASARADGDPASDVLLGENVFYPYTPPTSAALQKTLNAATSAAKAAGFPLKVALIASPVDLGVIPALFGKPQTYANFLDQEISFQQKQPLLVVMPAGYGVEGVPAASAAAVAMLAKPPGATSNDLAEAAVTAVGKLAAASGHPIKSDSSGGSHSSSGSSTTILIVLAAAALVVAGTLVILTMRRRRTATPHP
jgi:hypothetical protein